jgi:hypothetical protein
MMQLKKASRKQVKIKMNISGPSGSGKTMSALLLAYGITGDWEKIAVIDTENESASLYSHLGGFYTIALRPPFTPESYIEAIKACEGAGIQVCIIDSSTHEWQQLVEENDLLANARFRGNTWSAWSVSGKRHDAFLNTLLQSQMHIITCTRSKMETVLTDNNGKKEVKKVGMKDMQREGWEYELTISLNLNRETHTAEASKDRTNLFEGKQPFVVTKETGQKILEWCQQGVEVTQDDQRQQETILTLLNMVASLEELEAFWNENAEYHKEKWFKQAVILRKTELK